MVESFAKKGVGRWWRGRGGRKGEKTGLSSWVNNEACFLFFKGKVEKA